MDRANRGWTGPVGPRRSRPAPPGSPRRPNPSVRLSLDFVRLCARPRAGATEWRGELEALARRSGASPFGSPAYATGPEPPTDAPGRPGLDGPTTAPLGRLQTVGA